MRKTELERAGDLLARRDYGEGELLARGFSLATLRTLVERGFVNDERTIRSFLLGHPKWGRPRVRAALEARGFRSVDVEAALAEWPPEEERARALGLPYKKLLPLGFDPEDIEFLRPEE